MNAAHPSIENITFASSQRGWRYERLNHYAFVVSVTGGIFVIDSLRSGEPEWDVPIVFASVFAVMSWLMRGFYKRRVFCTRVDIREEHLDVAEGGVPSSIPWKDILYIRIDRSPSGHRRNVRIRACGGRLFTLLDPEDGERLELWALGVEQGKGIKVTLRTWVTLNAEPLWNVLLYVLAMAAAHVGIVRVLF